MDALSEDKRKIKRFLHNNNNKSRTQSMEPESAQIPMTNPYLLQQQQQQQQAQSQAQQQQMLMQQQILLQQQQQQQMLMQQQMPPPVHPPLGMPQNYIMMQQPVYDINSFNGRSPSNLSPFTDTQGQSPRSPLPKASKEFYALFRNGGKEYY